MNGAPASNSVGLPGRSGQLSTNWEGRPDEVSAAFHGYVAYYGSYKVDEGARVVTHRLKGSRTPPLPFQGMDRVFRAIWKRLE